MKKIFTLCMVFLWTVSAYAHGDIHSNHDPLLKRFITDNKRLPDQSYQEKLRSNPQWQSFLQSNGNWWVEFNETNQKPHRAFGAPLDLHFNGTPEAAALLFINNYLQAYIPSSVNLEFTGKTVSKKYVQPNFIQRYNGLEVLFSRATVKMTPDLHVVMFGTDIYDDITISTTAQHSLQDAIVFASAGINVTGVNANPQLKILPVPGKYSNIYKLVYEITVDAVDGENYPSKYYTLVDANTGEILYRDDIIKQFSDDITVNGTGYATHTFNPATSLPMQYVTVNIGGTDYSTDVNGFLNIPVATPVSATITLQGPNAKIVTDAGSVSPSFTTILNTGSNPVSFDATTSIRHISGYYHVNLVHDFMKGYFPTFTALDVSLPIRIDVSTQGTCNANYDGSGINFLAAGGGCNCLSQVSDVVYHEYGHGITNRFWGAHGTGFNNGAMGEGYSDVWAMCITHNPVLGVGFSQTDPNSVVRVYDFANGDPRKIYPQDIHGEVHDDGEIIAGAWWSTSLLLGNVPDMAAIFTESHNGLANGPDGAEGQVYTDILIDALQADDNDGNLQNGTPNINAILTGFAQHGITLLSNSNLVHTPVVTANTFTGINIDATLTNLQFAWMLQGVYCDYKINNSGWTRLQLSNTSGNNYTGTIPGQQSGTVISYYLYTLDINNYKSNLQPFKADATDPNIPYYIIVGYDKIFTEDFDFNAGTWLGPLTGDNATTGIWEQTAPDQVLINGSVAQPNTQVTPGGIFCYVTGGSETLPTGDNNDVDGGKTSIESPTFDLTGYVNPIFEYYRWYSNDQGATPGTDFFQTYISNDGINYIPVENTDVSDHSWRRFVFRVNDYVQANSTVSVRFVAEDAGAGSLVEALMDDFSMYSQRPESVNEISNFTYVTIWPNPTSDKLKIDCVLNQSSTYTFNILNNLGQVVYSNLKKLSFGKQYIEIPVNNLNEGVYQLSIQGPDQQKTMKFAVMH